VPGNAWQQSTGRRARWREILARATQIVGFEQHALDNGQQGRAGRRQPRQALAGAHKDIDAQLLLELANLPAHAGLRGVEHGRHFGQIEATPCRFPDRTQLLKIHILMAGGTACGCASRLFLFVFVGCSNRPAQARSRHARPARQSGGLF
jgi:hypothetical protein